MCLQTKMFVKSRDVVLMENGTSIRNALEIRLSGRDESPMAVVVDKYSKSSSCDDDEEWEEQVEDHLVANKEAIENPAVSRKRLAVRIPVVKSPLYLTENLLGGELPPVLWRWPIGLLFQNKK